MDENREQEIYTPDFFFPRKQSSNSQCHWNYREANPQQNPRKRIGSKCIVTFPNFGNWRTRAYLNFRGRMPVTKQLAYQWFDTPNIHFFTYADFEALCKERKINILHRQFLANGFPDKLLKSLWPNLFTEIAVYHLSR